MDTCNNINNIMNVQILSPYYTSIHSTLTVDIPHSVCPGQVIMDTYFGPAQY